MTNIRCGVRVRVNMPPTERIASPYNRLTGTVWQVSDPSVRPRYVTVQIDGMSRLLCFAPDELIREG